MDRKEIEKDYRVVDGIIHHPGKFEGEPVWAPHFYEAFSEGWGDEYIFGYDGNTTVHSIITLSPTDREQFPELDPETIAVHCWEDPSGFFSVETLTKDEVLELEARFEVMYQEEEDAQLEEWVCDRCGHEHYHSCESCPCYDPDPNCICDDDFNEDDILVEEEGGD